MMKNLKIVHALSDVISALGLFFSENSRTVGKSIREDDFQEFYYTVATTAYPPTFQRYRIYLENGKKMFYHEKREGNKVFLTEADRTLSGTAELTDEEWEFFWNCLNGGTVRNRKEDTSTGGSGPWLYLYWRGDRKRCQAFSFADAEKLAEFETFCEKLQSR